MNTPSPILFEIIQAFEELGGGADSKDVQALIERKRGNGYAPYKDRRHYVTTIRQRLNYTVDPTS